MRLVVVFLTRVALFVNLAQPTNHPFCLTFLDKSTKQTAVQTRLGQDMNSSILILKENLPLLLSRQLGQLFRLVELFSLVQLFRQLFLFDLRLSLRQPCRFFRSPRSVFVDIRRQIFRVVYLRYTLTNIPSFACFDSF